jgi:hypothetical protein
MHRRKFLGTVTLGAGFTVLPMWLSRAFGPKQDICPEDAPEPEHEPAVQVQHRPDCEPGTAPFKPLLILVIPADHAQQYRRGQAFGELINHGSDAQLAALACFEVRCLRLDQLDPPPRDPFVEEPLMLVLDHTATPSLLPLTAALTHVEDAPDRWDGRHDWEEIERHREAAIDARIATLAELIASAADGERLLAQACRERQGLPPADLQRLAELPHSLGELGPADLDRAPALGLLATRSGDAQQQSHLSTLLAASVRARLCDSPIPGAPWARTHGCGVTIEGAARQSRVACGMGSVPARSSRFLMFYSREH